MLEDGNVWDVYILCFVDLFIFFYLIFSFFLFFFSFLFSLIYFFLLSYFFQQMLLKSVSQYRPYISHYPIGHLVTRRGKEMAVGLGGDLFMLWR